MNWKSLGLPFFSRSDCMYDPWYLRICIASFVTLISSVSVRDCILVDFILFWYGMIWLLGKELKSEKCIGKCEENSVKKCRQNCIFNKKFQTDA